jgi:sulfotransferase family protein
LASRHTLVQNALPSAAARSASLDATRTYLFNPAAPVRVKQVLPGAKILCLLRNPVERAISSYFNMVNLGHEQLAIEQALAREDALIEQGDRVHPGFYYRLRGIYADQLRRWLARFPREQLLVCSSEQLYESPAYAYAEVVRFLGLAAWSPRCFPAHNRGSRKEVPADVRADLHEFFRPHNARLYELLDTDFGWD